MRKKEAQLLLGYKTIRSIELLMNSGKLLFTKEPQIGAWKGSARVDHRINRSQDSSEAVSSTARSSHSGEASPAEGIRSAGSRCQEHNAGGKVCCSVSRRRNPQSLAATTTTVHCAPA